jgi:hypothetical protein
MENVITATFRQPYAHGKNTIILSDYMGKKSPPERF